MPYQEVFLGLLPWFNVMQLDNLVKNCALGIPLTNAPNGTKNS